MSGINGRMFNRENYSRDTITTFAYISAYFIDLFYNEVYDRAVRLHRDRKINSITEGYKWALEVFLKKINEVDAETHRDIVNGIYHSFQQNGYTGMSYGNFIDRVVKEFVPVDYLKVVSFDDKTKVLTLVITGSVRSMINKIISKYLADVIDNHNTEENVIVWQEDFIEILIMQREKLYQNILDVKTGTSETGIVETMKKEIKLLFREKNKLKTENISLKKEIINLKNIILGKHKELEELRSQMVEPASLNSTHVDANDEGDPDDEHSKTPNVEIEFIDDDMFEL